MRDTAELQSTLRLYRRLMAYVWPYKWVFLASILGMAVVSVTEGGFAWIMKPLIDGGFVKNDASSIRYVPMLIIGIFVARGLFGFMASYATNWVGRQVIFQIRSQMFTRLVHLPSRFFDAHSSGILISKVIYDVEQVMAAATKAFTDVVKDNLSLVVLGTGDARYEELLSDLTGAYPEKFAVKLAYDEALAHRIEAGADIFLMPSHYEPCGLSQIYSLRYGTVPVVRATGGLDDSIDRTTGFKFSEYSAGAMLTALRSALEMYADRDGWKTMMRDGMARDYSWAASAGEYSALYTRLRLHPVGG